MPGILTVRQAAELLQAEERTVRSWLRQGRIPGRRIGREWRISEDGLHRWLNSGQSARRVSAFGLLCEVCGGVEGGATASERFLQEKHEQTKREEARLEKRASGRGASGR